MAGELWGRSCSITFDKQGKYETQIDLMKHITTLLLVLFLTFNALDADAQVPVDIDLIEFATGFDKPVDLVNAGDSRLFVVEKDGQIRILRADGTIDSTPFLNVQSLTSTSGNNDERGLLGLAFHPDYR